MKKIIVMLIFVVSAINFANDTIFEDYFESGSSNWVLTGNWAVVEEGEYHSATHSLTESPDTNYVVSESSTATLLNSVNLSAYWDATISFWCKYNIEEAFDYMYLEASEDSATWSNLKTWDGEGVDWYQENITLGVYCGDPEVYLRFRFESDEGLEFNGMYIDDILITGSNDTFEAVIDHSPYEPSFFEGTSDDYTNFVDVSSVAPLSDVEVIYYVDSLEQPNIPATFVSGTQWEFTIPSQAPGSLIEYTFWAQDITLIETYDDKTYKIIAGDHKIYDSNLASYYSVTYWGDAKAVKFDPIAMNERLYCALIRTYHNAGDTPNDMTFRIWRDDGTGKPGDELIVPFDITQAVDSTDENVSVTVVNLREYPVGEYWVGFTADYGSVNLVEEIPDIDSVTAYERSYEGFKIGGVWEWSLDSGSNYHIRVVTGEFNGIEDNYESTIWNYELEQNYPNPFNPNTTINFSIPQNNSQIKLVVYNVKGELVNTLFDGIRNTGKYTVNFDASTLNSGVYYYTLEVNGLKEATKKMVLIK